MSSKIDEGMGGESGAQREAGMMYMSCGRDYRTWQSGAQGTTHAVPIEDIGQLISSQLHVRPQLGPRPTHSHLACCDCLKLEVPATTLHRIGFLCPENAHSIPTGLVLYQTYKQGQEESKRLDGEWIQRQ